jgi:tetratricopeptide (TPR) repeat protein
MGIEDDIAASLPTPPHPAPARRAAAIEQALRRFDGLEDAEQSAPGSQSARRRPMRLMTSPYIGAFASFLLVALIGAPVLWNSMSDPVLTTGNPQTEATQSFETAEASGPVADAVRQEPTPPAEPTISPPVVAPPPMAGEDRASADMAVPAPALRAQLAPPPPPAQQMVRADALARAPKEEADSYAGEKVVVTGSRSLASPVAATAARAEAEDNAVVVSGTRRLPRGNWNSCTVDDPLRDLSACSPLETASKRASAAATATATPTSDLADGIARAWRGELDAAIDSFDRAIAAAPRSSAAYLNRGMAHRRDGDLDRALADLDRAVRYAPRDAKTYFNRSLVLRQKGDAARAAADERKALALDPSYSAVVR